MGECTERPPVGCPRGNTDRPQFAMNLSDARFPHTEWLAPSACPAPIPLNPSSLLPQSLVSPSMWQVGELNFFKTVELPGLFWLGRLALFPWLYCDGSWWTAKSKAIYVSPCLQSRVHYYYSFLYMSECPVPLLGRDLLNELGPSLFLGQNEVQGGKESKQRMPSIMSPRWPTCWASKYSPRPPPRN